MVSVTDGRWTPGPAEIIAVGSEMLTEFRLDTNSLFITGQLNQIGVEVRAKTVVGDNRQDLSVLFREALERSGLVVVTGGLGPTGDDITREVVAGVLGLELEERADLVETIRQRFRTRGLTMPESNRRQALVPRGAVSLANPNGTAAGLLIPVGGRLVVLLPGPPRELKPMFEAVIRDHLRPLTGSAQVYRRVVKLTGRSESYVDELAAPVYERWADGADRIETTILAVQGQIELHLSTHDEEESRAAARLDRMTADLVAVLRPAVYSTDGRGLEDVVGDLLRASSLRIATAESCTGGLLASRLTDVPGSSDYVDRGVVCYSNRAKTELLGVPEALIEEHGAVSEPVALAMATSVGARAGVEIGVGITGVAGPGGGTEAKPVGTVFIAVARGDETRVSRHQFIGHRALIKFHASQAALDMVRRWLQDS
jgi:nicotinamide-nucleotide amidase